MTKINVPRLRFMEFDGEWKEEKIREIADTFSGGTPNVNDKDNYGGNIPFIRSSDINKKDLELYLTDEGIQSSSAKLVKKGTLLVALYGATSGKTGISKVDGAINQAILAILPKEGFNKLYIYSLLNYKKNEIINKYIQGGQGNLSGKIINDLNYFYPDSNEQQVIGSFFAKIDKLIELQIQKLEQLKKLKRGYLQKMFPQYGKFLPRLRFSGFISEWKVSKGKAIFYNFSDKNHEDLPPLSVTQDQKIWYRDELDPALSYDKQKLSTYKLIDKNDVVIGLRSFVGGFAISDKRGIVSPAYTILKFRNTPWDFYFTRNLFTSYVFIQSLKKITYGIRVNGRSISYNDFSTLPLVYTDNLEEQKKIGSLLNTVDSLIELQEKKLDNIKKMKKAYLQKMFI